MEDAIVVRGLCKIYRGTRALEPLDLSVPRNTIFGFLGPNGAGKTTTMKILLGLIRPTAGTARLLGMDMRRDSVRIRSRIGYLPQDPRFYEHLTARQTVRFRASLYLRGTSRSMEDKVQAALELAGIQDRADRPVRGFSGGERQRLGLAQAVVNDPELLILDEPAANLDPIGRRDVLELLDRLRARCTVFYSTHILDDVERVSDSVAILDRGKLLAHGPVPTLVAGGGRPVHRLSLLGDASRARAVLEAEPWVDKVEVQPDGERTMLRITIRDASAAQVHLLRRVLADPEARVISYGPEIQNLEEVFLQMVEGGANG